MAYYVYSGNEHFTDPVASFSTEEHALLLSQLLGSLRPPVEIYVENSTEIDKYLHPLIAGKTPYFIALYGDGTLFEIDHGFELTELSDPVYFPEQEGAFSGTFWASSSHEAIELAQQHLTQIQSES